MALAAHDGRLVRFDGRQHHVFALTRLDARGEVVRVERDRHLGAAELGVEFLGGVTHVLGDGSEPQHLATHLQAHGGGVLGEDLHAANGLEQRLALDGQLIRVAGRDELPVVGRELLVDEAGAQLRGAHLERRITVAESHRHFAAAAEQSLQFVQRPAGNQHLLVGRQHLLTGKVAQREPVRVGGHHAQAIGLGRHEHARQHRAVVIGAGGTHHLTQGVAERSGWQGDRRVHDRRHLRIVVEAEGANAEARPAVADHDRVGLGAQLDLAGAERSNDVGRQSGRQHRATIDLAADLDRQLDGQVEVGAGHRQTVALHFEPQPGEHRQRAGSTGGGGAAGGGQRLGKGLTLATELHSGAFLDRVSVEG